MDTPEKIAKWATENRESLLLDSAFYNKILSSINELIEDIKTENWEQNEQNNG